MPGTVGNTEVIAEQRAPEPVLTTAACVDDEVDFGEELGSPYGHRAHRDGDRYSLNRVMRDLRRRQTALALELTKVNEAIALLESDSRAINIYRIVSEGF